MHIYGKYFIAILHLPLLHTSEICMLEHQLETFHTTHPNYATNDEFLQYLQRNTLSNFPNNQKTAFSFDNDNQLSKEGAKAATQVLNALEEIAQYFNLQLNSYNPLESSKFLTSPQKHPYMTLSFRDEHNVLGPYLDLFTPDTPFHQNLNYLDSNVRKMLKNPARINETDIPPRNQEYLQGMTNLYKIHLMPFKDDIPIVLFMLICELIKRHDLWTYIGRTFIIQHNFSIAIKFNITEPEKGQRDRSRQVGNIPTIVIYVENGISAAQKVLNSIYNLFRNRPGTDITPRWNKRITSLIFWAQGDGDVKANEDLYHLFSEDRICYRADLTGKIVDYYLKNPEHSSI